jgi:light-regulated signal transduction histidine kinase (bacteriophytochrome)
MNEQEKEILQLQYIIRDLEEKNEELEQFVSHATHEFKEPIRTMGIGAEVLLKKYKDKIDAEGLQMLEYILSSSKRFDKIISALKNYTKADKGKLHIKKVKLDILVSEVLEDINVLLKVTQAKVVLDNLFEIETDAEKLKMVFTHIIDNALRYRGNHHPEIRIGASEKDNRYTIYIEDNGIGIEESKQAHVLKPFERLHSKFEIDGVGLGLPLSQKILKRLKGELWLKSEAGKGTTVFITLPKKLYAE